MASVETQFPEGLKWRIDNNNAEDFRSRLSLVLKNGFMAIGIVLLILAIFLEFRLAFWVMAGMSISFVGGILFYAHRWREHQHDLALRLLDRAGYCGRRCSP